MKRTVKRRRVQNCDLLMGKMIWGWFVVEEDERVGGMGQGGVKSKDGNLLLLFIVDMSQRPVSSSVQLFRTS